MGLVLAFEFDTSLVNSALKLLCSCRYVFGITHVPRLEDWPVMPVERIGFLLQVCFLNMLFGFFFFPFFCRIFY